MNEAALVGAALGAAILFGVAVVAAFFAAVKSGESGDL